MIFSRSMLLQMAIFHSFLWLSNIPLYPSIYTYFFFLLNQSSVDGHLGCFHVLSIVINAIMNIGVHVPFIIRSFIFSEYMPKSGIDGSYGNSSLSF